ncbi:MAG: hypothetical protein LBO04_04735 [Spirochaetaceae bacterium]|jgi:translation elongation factor EF-Ts|nr:hypothetical protein [Spirochaetaceae bacterium]
MTGIYAVTGLTGLCVIFILMTVALAKRVKKYRQENAGMRVAMEEAAARLEHAREYMRKNKIAEEDANEQRQELNDTADGCLASRANSLFGVRDKPDGGNSRT